MVYIFVYLWHLFTSVLFNYWHLRMAVIAEMHRVFFNKLSQWYFDFTNFSNFSVITQDCFWDLTLFTLKISKESPQRNKCLNIYICSHKPNIYPFLSKLHWTLCLQPNTTDPSWGKEWSVKHWHRLIHLRSKICTSLILCTEVGWARSLSARSSY